MITYETVKDEVAGIVRSNPGYTYKSTDDDMWDHDIIMLFHGDEPGCLLGHWLTLHGITREDVTRAGINSAFFVRSAVKLVDDVDDSAMELLHRITLAEYYVYPWEEAFNRAVAWVEENNV